jgi:cytochrome c
VTFDAGLARCDVYVRAPGCKSVLQNHKGEVSRGEQTASNRKVAVSIQKLESVFMSSSRSSPLHSEWAFPQPIRRLLAGCRAQRCRYTGLVILPIAILLSGCLGGKAHPGYGETTDPAVERGQQVIVHYQCGKCHTIPGIRDAHGVFGPPLIAMGSRTVIAGNFPNLPENLAHWVKAPTSMKPKTAMPDLGLTDQQALDVAAYLETLH